MKVSVIVPCYQVEKTLRTCLDSLVGQTLKELEIIAVDDGSTDQTWNILNEYREKYPRKIKIFQKKNGGLGSARNLGLDHAKGEFIGFVDSDDYVEKTFYEKLYCEVNEQVDLVEGNFVWEYPDKNKKDIGISFQSHIDFIAHGRILVCNKIYRRSMIEINHLRFPVGLRYEDIPFTLTFILTMREYRLVQEFGYHYIQSPHSLSNYQTEKVRDIFSILSLVREYYQKNQATEEELSALEYFSLRVLLGSSFLRVIQIKDPVLRKCILKETWQYLNDYYPSWKQNRYLREKGIVNWYYRMMNYPLLNLMAIGFRVVKQ